MGEIRLGKIHLRWCDRCNVPVLEQASCGICSGATREVRITPPGDARPAFYFDVRRVRSLADRQFGPGTGQKLIPEGRVVILNKAPDIDRMDEVIVDGEVVAAMRFDLVRGEELLLRPGGAAAIAPRVTKSWVKVDAGAVESIRDRSSSTLAVGVLECDPSIRPGDEVLVLDPEGAPVSVGMAKMSSEDMTSHRRGTAVKTRWAVGVAGQARECPPATWNEVLSANREVIHRRTQEAIRFVKDVSARQGLPVAVSYSGGKDSLATLLLVLDSGIKPKLLFIDTGIEFEETRKNVHDVARRHSLELIVEAAGDAFWRNLERFGPPAKDFRWCCKTCKLGPATRLIQRRFPEGVLSFIGQRGYESEQRARKGKVWRNPWTPNQLAASPIQKWTALHVWLYLFTKGVDANPLYEQGLERIGCFMCPATDLAELRRVKEISPEYGRWQGFLEAYASKTSKGAEWLEFDLWRWKRLPKSVVDELGVQANAVPSATGTSDSSSPLELRSTSGYSPCVEGLSMEGVFSRSLDMGRVANMLNILGEVATSPDGGIAEVDKMTVFSEGAVMVKAKDDRELRAKSARLREVVIRAVDCAGCGICTGRCPTGALTLDGMATIDVERCNHCGSCLGPCPVVAFRDDELDI